MKLALRHTLSADAPALHRLAAACIETRLVTQFAHGGIIVGDQLLHATATGGVHRLPASVASDWTLIDLGTEHDARALELFAAVEGAGYDWVSLLAFVVAPATDRHRWYCFELCWLLMTGEPPRGRVTPERLLLLAMRMGGRLVMPAVR